jgi:addiction module HigA family antidote
MKLPTPRVKKPAHPGEILEEEFLKPMNLSRSKLAQQSGITATTIQEICRGERGITAKTALRLGAFFKTAPETWLQLQLNWDLWQEWIKLQKKVS